MAVHFPQEVDLLKQGEGREGGGCVCHMENC